MSVAGDLVASLSGLRRAVQLYPPQHPSYIEAVERTVAGMNGAAAGGPFVLNLHQGRLYSGSEPLPGDIPAAGALAESMERHTLESLTFEPGCDATDAVALAEVLNLRPSPSLDVQAELANRGSSSIVVAALAPDEDEQAEREERDRARQKDRATYRQLVSSLKAIDQQASKGGSPDFSHAASMVGDIMGRLVQDESAVLGMALMNSADESALFHSVNVMIYSLTLGLALGLPDEGLLALGMSAMLHDIGKAAFNQNDPDEARACTLLHPKIGADMLGRVADSDRTPMLVAYEHHMGADGSGYPDRPADYIGHPYSRMVAISDRYEHLVRGGDAAPCSPDRAVMQVLREAGKSLDPFFSRLFVRALGVFPIGCVVRLSDQSVAVVRAKTDDLLLPIVRVVYDAEGVEPETPPDVDLRESELRVVEVMEADALKLAVADKL